MRILTPGVASVMRTVKSNVLVAMEISTARSVGEKDMGMGLVRKEDIGLCNITQRELLLLLDGSHAVMMPFASLIGYKCLIQRVNPRLTCSDE